ncbi:MAG TPA: carbamoyl-phosphate synthase small subunit [Planctomycetes bacterium]|nr:glutamine-hydrolyzing carbamoyl-phosphate synthase small subunit [Planctomycetaceae bacterium]HIM28593.1 carbamoyl-phosphate synthase small subunit [Planctomycetota bacterium]
MMQSMQPAKLALEDGTVYPGISFGAAGEVEGEVVFNTSMTGYQEILTDPSYRGQIVTMTYPEIGNCGVNSEDVESAKPHLAGFVVRTVSRIASNFRSEGRLDDYLKQHGIVAISGIDTRSLVRRIRSKGAMSGVLSTTDLDDESLVAKARASQGLVGRDLVKEVLPQSTQEWTEKLSDWSLLHKRRTLVDDAPHIVALDFGMKWNIPRHLADRGCKVTILPGNTPPEDLLALKPDGIFLSNGPGDPEPVEYGIETIRALLGKVPIFGICLGHQLLSLACNAKTFKLKFGHRGANQPVLKLDDGTVEITSQNHGFAVDRDTLPDDLEVTHVNLNDDTVAGIRHKVHNAFSVQYHPEASAGPHDSHYLFDEFIERIVEHRKAK